MELQAVKQRFGIIGNSPLLNNVLNKALQVASTNLTVLITGESGVGKEVISKIIHQLGSRKHNSFIAVNCGAIPEGTIDSELFGHEKGAFTDAHEARKGYFEHANDGTIFLDEVSEMPLGTQTRLLRILESGEFIKVGSSKVQKTDVRIISATNKDLNSSIETGKFREDLYYRLNTVPIFVSPLRERKEDIPLLFKKFCNDFADTNKSTPIQLESNAIEILANHRWYGNVRELKNVAEQISVLSKEKGISAEELIKYIPNVQKQNLPMLSKGTSEFSERELLYRVLFDMKKDMNDLKQIVAELLRNNAQPEFRKSSLEKLKNDSEPSLQESYNDAGTSESETTVILSDDDYQKYKEAEVVEESLSIADKEIELINKALKKHKGKRKYAAADLGISERTLYRKIKEYDIKM